MKMWRNELDKVFADDFKDWYDNSDEDRPRVVRMVIEGLEEREELALSNSIRLQKAIDIMSKLLIVKQQQHGLN